MNRSANVNTIDLLFSKYKYISCQVKVRVLCSIEIRNCWLFQTHTMQLAWRIVLHLHSTNPLYAETHHVLLLHPSLLKVISLSYLPLSRKVSTKEAPTALRLPPRSLNKDKTVSQNLREEGTRQKREASPSSSSKQLEQGLQDGADIGMQQSRSALKETLRCI